MSALECSTIFACTLLRLLVGKVLIIIADRLIVITVAIIVFGPLFRKYSDGPKVPSDCYRRTMVLIIASERRK